MSLEGYRDTDLRRAFAGRGDPGDPGPVCPRSERLWSAFHGELGASETRRVVLHLAECSVCSESWRLASHLGRWPGENGHRRRGAWSWPGLERVAAVLVAALALALWLPSLERPSSDRLAAVSPETTRIERGSPPAGEPAVTVRRGDGAAVVESLLDETQPLPRESFVLRWTPLEGARYDLVLMTAELDVVAEAVGLEEASHRVPAEALGGLEAGSELLWQVEAELADGRRGTSNTFIVKIK